MHPARRARRDALGYHAPPAPNLPGARAESSWCPPRAEGGGFKVEWDDNAVLNRWALNLPLNVRWVGCISLEVTKEEEEELETLLLEQVTAGTAGTARTAGTAGTAGTALAALAAVAVKAAPRTWARHGQTADSVDGGTAIWRTAERRNGRTAERRMGIGDGHW